MKAVHLHYFYYIFFDQCFANLLDCNFFMMFLMYSLYSKYLHTLSSCLGRFSIFFSFLREVHAFFTTYTAIDFAKVLYFKVDYSRDKPILNSIWHTYSARKLFKKNY